MFSLEDRKKAVELYLKYGRNSALVLRELGYPKIAILLKTGLKSLREAMGSCMKGVYYLKLKFLIHSGTPSVLSIHHCEAYLQIGSHLSL